MLTPAAFASRTGNEAFDLSSVYQDLIAKRELAGFEVPERFYEIGSIEGLEELRRELRANAPH